VNFDRPRKSSQSESAHVTDLPVRVITPHSGLEAFAYAINSVIRDFPQSRALAWRMLVRDTQAMYRKSMLGYGWLFISPLVTVLVWVFLNKTSLVNIDAGTVPYPLFVITGTVLWTAFNSSVMAMQEIIDNAHGVLSKVNFPHESLIMSALGKATINSVIPASLLLPALLIYGAGFSFSMLLFPLGFCTIILLGCALGLIFVPIGALYGDVGRLVQMGLRFGFFVTPVIYALPASGFHRTLLLWNPVTAPLVSARSWLIGGEPVYATEMAVVFVASLLLLGIAVIMFKVVMPHLIERLNS
jgi:lipopolysaccharide transport system permease protein